MQNNKVTGITGKLSPEMDMKHIEGGFAKLYFDMDLWLYKLVTFRNGTESIEEILSPSVAINSFKDLKWNLFLQQYMGHWYFYTATFIY